MCIPESYKDPQEHISRRSRNQSVSHLHLTVALVVLEIEILKVTTFNRIVLTPPCAMMFSHSALLSKGGGTL